MKKLLQVLSTAVVGAVLMGGVVGATSDGGNCNIYQKNSESYNSCLQNQDSTSVQVTCVNNVYVINNTSQKAGTGNATITNNGGYAASGSATNTNGATVTIGASCGQAPAPAPSSSSSSSPSCGSSKTCPSSSSSAAAKTSVAASSLPETGSNTVVNGAVIASVAMISVLGISYAAGALYRRLATKE